MLSRFDRLAPFTNRFLHILFFTSRRLLADILHTSLRSPYFYQNVIGLCWSANTYPATFPSDMTCENDELRHDMFNASFVFPIMVILKKVPCAASDLSEFFRNRLHTLSGI